MKKNIIESLTRRLKDEVAPQSPIKFLKEKHPEDVLEIVTPIVYLYTRVKKGSDKQIYLTEVISAMGHAVMQRFGLPKNSSTAAKVGAFILYSFEECRLLQVTLGRGKTKHAAYVVEILDDAAITKLWEDTTVTRTEKLPALTPYAPWTTSRHPTGLNLVKTWNRDVLGSLTLKSHPIVFECVNRAQEVGWMINSDVMRLVKWAMRNKTDAFADIWELQDQEAKASKMREVRTIISVAQRFEDNIFYHLYYYDFRGRKYPATAFLHEQGSDLARGLLLRADSKPIGERGFQWLMISLANNWAGSSGREDGRKTDKIPLHDRFVWGLDNEELFLSYASDPKVNQGWMRADKPWQFLAACIELLRFRQWQALHKSSIAAGTIGEYEFSSHLEVFVDGSNNGSQHLSALTRDEVTAPHVNLVPQPYPGDLYEYVAAHVWKKIDAAVNALPKDKRWQYERVVDEMVELKLRVGESDPRSEERAVRVDMVRQFRKDHDADLSAAAVVFWHKITDAKHKRKIVKRNTMTLPLN